MRGWVDGCFHVLECVADSTLAPQIAPLGVVIPHLSGRKVAGQVWLIPHWHPRLHLLGVVIPQVSVIKVGRAAV